MISRRYILAAAALLLASACSSGGGGREVPITATDGLTDSVRVMLTGTDVAALAQLVTTADILYAIYLPLLRKD